VNVVKRFNYKEFTKTDVRFYLEKGRSLRVSKDGIGKRQKPAREQGRNQ